MRLLLSTKCTVLFCVDCYKEIMQAAAAEMQAEAEVIDLSVSDNESDSEDEDDDEDDEEERDKDADFLVCGDEEEEEEGLDDDCYRDIMSLDAEEGTSSPCDDNDKSGFKGARHMQSVIEKYQAAFARGLGQHKRDHDNMSSPQSSSSNNSSSSSSSEAEDVRHVRCKIECIYT